MQRGITKRSLVLVLFLFCFALGEGARTAFRPTVFFLVCRWPMQEAAQRKEKTGFNSNNDNCFKNIVANGIGHG